MPVPVDTRQSHEAPAHRRNASRYGLKPSLFDELCSIAFEKSTLLSQKRRASHSAHHHHPHPHSHSHPHHHQPDSRTGFVAHHPPIHDHHRPASSHSRHMTAMEHETAQKTILTWDWQLEHADRKKEARADGAVHDAPPFQVDRKLLKDIVHEKMATEVARITYLGAGTFHKGYLVTLVDGVELVARVARRFMPRLKTESEVATMRYLRERTSVPVPTVYHYDSNPYNRLGGEYILMSKAVGVPLARVFHSMSYTELIGLMRNVVAILLPLYALRFPRLGSLYDGADPQPMEDRVLPSSQATPTATQRLTRTLSMAPLTDADKQACSAAPRSEFHVGPIVSWPFFGSNRGDLAHPDEINRGPWTSTHAYLRACADREITGVVLENEGKTAPHHLHLDPDEILSSRHHKMSALSGDVSDTSDEWDWEESQAEWDGPGHRMYEDYRRMQRSTFLVAHLQQREQKVKEEMERFIHLMERLGVANCEKDANAAPEEFALDCHDLNLENVFVDPHDVSKITCIIDWESTSTRPLWAAAHVPAFLQNSPFTSKLFRATVEKIATQQQTVVVGGQLRDLSQIAEEWLHYEASGARLRMAHRCIEWDGWEEGLVGSILGPPNQEEDWFKSWDEANAEAEHADADAEAFEAPDTPDSPLTSTSPTLTESEEEGDKMGVGADAEAGRALVKPRSRAAQQAVRVVAAEKERERLLNATGDICGGRGGELGRRLEAWLCVNGDEEGRVELTRRWAGGVEDAAAIAA